MLISRVLEYARLQGRLGFIPQTTGIPDLLNEAYIDIARRAQPLALLTPIADSSYRPLYVVDEDYYIRYPTLITEADLENPKYEIVLDDILFDAFTYGYLYILNTSSENRKVFEKKYFELCGLYRQNIHNMRQHARFGRH